MSSQLINQARSMVRESMQEIRSKTPTLIHNHSSAMTIQTRSDLLDDIIVKRLIIHLHSSGCGWVQKSGGCTMCGFYAATSTGVPISSDDYIKQVSEELSRHDPKTYSIIGLYNAGNILNDSEMPFDALEQICINISKNPYIKRISFESKLEYIDGEKLKRIKTILFDKEIELGIGVESLNENIRDLCINKPFTNKFLQNSVDILLNVGVIPKAYLLLKPPFLTEKESIDDLVASYNQLKQMGVNRINCETMTIEKHTLVYELWKNNYYRTPWLWSIISIIQQLGESRLYFTPFEYIVDAESTAYNCDRCSDDVKNKIFNYQDNKIDYDELIKANCSCKEEWIDELGKTDTRAIETRILDTLSQINNVKENL